MELWQKERFFLEEITLPNLWGTQFNCMTKPIQNTVLCAVENVLFHSIS